MEKFEGGELAAQFPPQGCGASPPLEVAVAGGAAHVDVDDIGGGVEGATQPTMSSTPCCPDSYVASSNCWWATGRAW